MAFILLWFSMMANTPAMTTPTPNTHNANVTSQESSSSIQSAQRTHNRIFAAYVFFLLVTAFFTYWVWSSGNKVQDAVQSEARARISEAHLKIAELTNDNLRLQHMLSPRRIRLLDKNGDKELRLARFQQLAKYANTFAVIQSVPDFESETLASDIQNLLVACGWTTMLLDESRTNISSRKIAEGVRVVTLESRPFDLNNNPRSVVTSDAGEAAKTLVGVLMLDLTTPFGKQSGVEWAPEYGGRFAPFKRGITFPKADVLILVGMKPVAGILGGRQAAPTVNNR